MWEKKIYFRPSCGGRHAKNAHRKHMCRFYSLCMAYDKFGCDFFAFSRRDLWFGIGFHIWLGTTHKCRKWAANQNLFSCEMFFLLRSVSWRRDIWNGQIINEWKTNAIRSWSDRASSQRCSVLWIINYEKLEKMALKCVRLWFLR